MLLLGLALQIWFTCNNFGFSSSPHTKNELHIVQCWSTSKGALLHDARSLFVRAGSLHTYVAVLSVVFVGILVAAKSANADACVVGACAYCVWF